MNVIQKPILAATAHSKDLSDLTWPMLASPKIDGIRCLMHPEFGPVTRSFKPVPNIHVRTQLIGACDQCPLDGELVGVTDGTLDDFNTTQSKIMSQSGEPTFVFRTFDLFANPEQEYHQRYLDMVLAVSSLNSRLLEPVMHYIMYSADDFAKYAEICAAEGYEGAMLRAMDGPYKNGRSTLKQQYLLKYKEWQDAEGVVIGIEEKMHNDNEDIKDNFGYAKRTSHKDGLRPAGTAGALVLHTEWGELRVGTGFDDSMRSIIWSAKEQYIGRTVVFKYQAFGMQDKPRFPVFKAFRDTE